MIYHITSKADWEDAVINGNYHCGTLHEEGYIHASEDHQVEGVLQRYFSGRHDLVKLVIDPGLLRSQIVHEWSPSIQDTFPHIYGPINVDAVVKVETCSLPQN
ncbi:DUF952 domain-containing protein [Flavihumibacter solisilvae]|jgi:uncharacterized protein (DUF952 family)|uniref:DUF952 domain-containing protein n=1 Tax=Flavihumibacter solisilvae TaxID=1349421 RepID=UPI0009077EAB|nr:DUF952 domain-containing protein [Flavihumibacter solisilvae]